MLSTTDQTLFTHSDISITSNLSNSSVSSKYSNKTDDSTTSAIQLGGGFFDDENELDRLIMKAFSDNKAEVACYLLSNKKSIKYNTKLIDEGKRNLLHYLTIYSSVDCINKHLYNILNDTKCIKRQLNKQDEYGNTPAHYAARLGFDSLIDKFVKRGADLTIKNKKGEFIQGETLNKTLTEGDINTLSENIFMRDMRDMRNIKEAQSNCYSDINRVSNINQNTNQYANNDIKDNIEDEINRIVKLYSSDQLSPSFFESSLSMDPTSHDIIITRESESTEEEITIVEPLPESISKQARLFSATSPFNTDIRTDMITDMRTDIRTDKDMLDTTYLIEVMNKDKKDKQQDKQVVNLMGGNDSESANTSQILSEILKHNTNKYDKIMSDDTVVNENNNLENSWTRDQQGGYQVKGVRQINLYSDNEYDNFLNGGVRRKSKKSSKKSSKKPSKKSSKKSSKMSRMNTDTNTEISEMAREITNQANDVHDRAIEKIAKILNLDRKNTDDDLKARVYKNAIYRMVKKDHPELNYFDRAVEMEKSITKDALNKIDIKKELADREKIMSEKADSQKSNKPTTMSSLSSTPVKKSTKKQSRSKNKYNLSSNKTLSIGSSSNSSVTLSSSFNI
jgi:hypothetical protein